MSSTFPLTMYIKETIKDYQEVLKDTADETVRFKYECYIKALERLMDKISIDFDYNSSEIIANVLSENYGRFDTVFIGWDNQEILLVPKDTVTMVKGDFLCILGGEDLFEEQIKNKESPILFEALSLDSIKEFKTRTE